VTLYRFGAVPNFLDDESLTFHTSIGGWGKIVFDPGDESDIELFQYTATGIDDIEGAALGVKVYGPTLEAASAGPPVGLPVGASVGPYEIPSFFRTSPIRGHVKIKFDSPAYVKIGLIVTGEGAGVYVSSESELGERIRADEWTLISVETPGIPNPHPSASCQVSLAVSVVWEDAPTGEEAFYLKWPTICTPDVLSINYGASETYLRLPEYMRDADAFETEPNFPMLRFIDAITPVVLSVDFTRTLYQYVPPEDAGGTPLFSGLTEPSVAEQPEARWLSQLVGVDLIDPRSGATTWGALLSAADTGGDSSGEASWEEFVDAVDDAATGNDDGEAQWGEIQEFAVDSNFTPEILLSFTRWQVDSAAYGLRGGTTTSLIEAAKQGLKSVENPVTVVPHADGDPFKIRVEVLSADVKTSIDDVQILINPATPLGYEVVAVEV
jgi:hypothetical protein